MRPPARSGGSAGLRRRAGLVQLLCASAGLVLGLLLPRITFDSTEDSRDETFGATLSSRTWPVCSTRGAAQARVRCTPRFAAAPVLPARGSAPGTYTGARSGAGRPTTGVLVIGSDPPR